jgi:CTP:molybdopterin cytidylyltransferase MocA
VNAAIILAAGESRRMGMPKALLDAGGVSFLVRLARVFVQADCSVWIVTGATPLTGPSGVAAVENASWRDGQWSSARVGLRAALAAGADRLLVHPVDVPLISPDTARALLSALTHSPAVVAAYRGAGGHPLGLTAASAQALLDAPDLPHLEAGLQRVDARLLDVDDPAVLQEVDTPEEYRALFGRAPQRSPT